MYIFISILTYMCIYIYLSLHICIYISLDESTKVSIAGAFISMWAPPQNFWSKLPACSFNGS